MVVVSLMGKIKEVNKDLHMTIRGSVMDVDILDTLA